MSSLIFFLNKDISKTSSDRIHISIQNSDAIITYNNLNTVGKMRMPKEEVQSYMSDLLDLLALDVDSDKMKYMDVVTTNMPIVCVPLEDLNKDLVLGIVKRFVEYSHA